MSDIEKELIDSIIYTSFFVPLVLAALIVWFVIFYQRKKYRIEMERKDMQLKHQALIIEKQEAIEYERTRIAAEMHDDLGSGLTTIKYLSEHALKSTKDPSEKTKINRIADHANTLVTNMSEIIWAMNSRYDTASDLVGYIRRYASEYLDIHNKELVFESDALEEDLEISGEKRRNIFLVTKEILHNFVKYAGVRTVQIRIMSNKDQFDIQFLEPGNPGFEFNEASTKGNGLYNMDKRMKRMDGSITRETTEKGLMTTISYPIK
jgi:signal transduction histidine kinase